MFRGRETTHPERGRDLLMRLADDVKEIGQVESPPLLDGRNMVMMLGPTKNAGVKKDDAKAKDTQLSEEAVQGDRNGQAPAPPKDADDPSGPPGEEQVREAEARPASRVRRPKRPEGRQEDAGTWLSDATRQTIGSRTQEAPQGARAGPRLLGPQALELQARQGAARPLALVRLPRPEEQEAHVPPPLDHADQRGRAAGGHVVQPARGGS